MYQNGDFIVWNNQPAQIISKEDNGIYIRAWSLKNLKPFKHPHYALFVIREKQIQGLLKAQDVQDGQIVMYYGQPATVVELPNMVSWAYIVDVNGQKVVTTIFQLDDINY